MANTPPNRVQIIKSRYDSATKVKQHWLTMWQLVGEYVMTRKQNFLTTPLPGEFLTEQLFSSVAPEANRTMASAIVGNLWPNGGRSFKFVRPRNIPDGADVKQYYDTITNVLSEIMDIPEAGLARALSEYMLDQGAFGISGINVNKTGNLSLPLRYRATNVKEFAIEENKDGVVDTIFIDRELTVRTAVDEYGVENLSKKVQDQYKNGELNEKVRVLWFIEPRRNDRYGFGNKSLPIASIHIEFDTNKILRESGFSQMPVIISRFLQALGESYGRSPAMFALPAILRLNVCWELILRAGEKQLNPPLYLLDSGALGGSIVDTSAGALNVFNVTGLGEKSPVGALFDVGDMRPMLEIVQQLMEDVTKAFYIDRLMDLNNETRMTLGETQIRDRIRGEGMTSVFKQQESELFSPLIRTSFNFCFEDGLMGVVKGSRQEAELIKKGYAPIYIPPAIVKAIEQGQKVYDIKYISPASRLMRMEELQGTTQTLDIAIGLAQGGMTDVLDNFDPDVIIKKINELTGSTDQMLRDSKTIQKIREVRAAQIQEAQNIQKQQATADTTMKLSQAQSMIQGSISGRPRG